MVLVLKFGCSISHISYSENSCFGVANRCEQAKSWVWFCVFGSLLFLIGGLVNLLKVYKMQQTDGLRLEKLRGGAQERLSRHREGRVPLNWEETAGAGRAAVAGEPRAIP